MKKRKNKTIFFTRYPDDWITEKIINHKMGLPRLFRELKKKCPHHGELILLHQILNSANSINKPFSYRSILNVTRKYFDDKIFGEEFNVLKKLSKSNIEVLKTKISPKQSSLQKSNGLVKGKVRAKT